MQVGIVLIIILLDTISTKVFLIRDHQQKVLSVLPVPLLFFPTKEWGTVDFISILSTRRERIISMTVLG